MLKRKVQEDEQMSGERVIRGRRELAETFEGVSDFVKGQIGKEEARAVFVGPLLVTLIRAVLVVGWEQGVKNWELKQWGQEVWTILFKSLVGRDSGRRGGSLRNKVKERWF